MPTRFYSVDMTNHLLNSMERYGFVTVEEAYSAEKEMTLLTYEGIGRKRHLELLDIFDLYGFETAQIRSKYYGIRRSKGHADMTMTPDEITTALKLAADRGQTDKRNDVTIAKISRVMKKLPPDEQMVVLAAYQASLILEISNMDKERAKLIWQAGHALSAAMLRDFHAEMEKPENKVH